MWAFALLCLAFFGMAHTAYSGSASAGGYAGASSGGGSYGGGSYGGGGFGGGGYGSVYGPAFPFIPIPGFDNRFGAGPAHVSDFLQNLQSQHASSLSMASTTDDATAQASAALFDENLFQQQLQHQAALFNTIQDRFGDIGTTTTTGGVGSGPNYAAASASYGPGGGHQAVYISPPNPNVPNIHTRFDTAGTPGNVGISTSSFSSSSDVNGMKTNRRGAVTSVNDNGKVTTYYTHS